MSSISQNFMKFCRYVQELYENTFRKFEHYWSIISKDIKLYNSIVVISSLAGSVLIHKYKMSRYFGSFRPGDDSRLCHLSIDKFSYWFSVSPICSINESKGFTGQTGAIWVLQGVFSRATSVKNKFWNNASIVLKLSKSILI